MTTPFNLSKESGVGVDHINKISIVRVQFPLGVRCGEEWQRWIQARDAAEPVSGAILQHVAGEGDHMCAKAEADRMNI